MTSSSKYITAPLTFRSGHIMKNRFMLAPMTNTQSHADGRLSDDELHWLTMRAAGGFGMVMTCASHVQAIGQGFPGQLGKWDDRHIDGHKRITAALVDRDALPVIQLHHAGMRSPTGLIGRAPQCPSDHEKYGAQAMTIDEVEQTKQAFIQAALRAQTSGYAGIELHAAHGYLLAQFISPEVNQREDAYGGDLAGRSRLLMEIIDGVRASCGRDFLLGVRLSPERFGMKRQEIKTLCHHLVASDQLDFLDLSLWDIRKVPTEEGDQGQTLLEHITSWDFGSLPVTVAGGISTGADVQYAMDLGVDFVSIGRAAILHHDYPLRVMADPTFTPVKLPVTPDYLKAQGLGADFITYMRRWPDFVADVS